MTPPTPEERYFLDHDDDGHWYVVPVSLRAVWEAWLALDPDDEAGWEPPPRVRAVGGSPSLITFVEVRFDG